MTTKTVYGKMSGIQAKGTGEDVNFVSFIFFGCFSTVVTFFWSVYFSMCFLGWSFILFHHCIIHSLYAARLKLLGI